MAQMTGYVCDVCSIFSLSRDKWLKLTSFTDNRVSDTGFDICSNKCLVKIARTRLSENAGANGIPGERSTRPRREHSTEFKADVVAMVESGEYTAHAAARKFNLSPSLVRNWCSQFSPGYGQ
jgi:Transposase